ncbi:ABC transporter permease [Phytomonospora sp. NPDC050363]|uniref:ABC transporter permease n=1 Tax=Phytomonospora sp. NPDC050363 TaxID=3155642 RepID=UPI00340CA9D1
MNVRTTPIRAGLARGWIETKHTLRSYEGLAGFLFPSVIAMVVIFFLRGVDIPGAPVSLGSMSLPSLIGLNIAFGGLLGVVQTLTVEREDGTLLRAKTLPGGMTAYLIGIIVETSIFVIFGAALVLIPGLFVFEGVAFDGPGSWLLLITVLVFGLVATMPIGAVLGSVFSNPRMLGLIMMPIMGLVAISGIFYPLSQMPSFLQGIGQAFPIYWLGHGMRAALLPSDMAAAEIGGSWRLLETFGVLGLWALLGLVLAPIVLRRMARRESGSAVAERRERAMQRIT